MDDFKTSRQISIYDHKVIRYLLILTTRIDTEGINVHI